MRRFALLMVLLSVMVVGLGVENASAAACTAMSCNGKDPHTTKCDVGATTIDEFTSAVQWRYELRYSSTCNAVWTRLTTKSSGWCTSTIFGQIRGYDLSSHALKISYGVQAPCAGQRAWTKMISFPNYWIRTCEATWFSGSPRVCTDRR